MPLKHSDINKETERSGEEKQQDMTASTTKKGKQEGKTENKPRVPREQPLQWNVIKATATGKPSRPTRTAERREEECKKDELAISMASLVQYQGAGMSRVIGLSGFCVLSRARESWLEALGVEERLKLEQRSVTFAGSFLLLEQEEERNTEGLRSLMAGQRRASACLSFRLDSIGSSWMAVLLIRAATLPIQGVQRFCSCD